MNYTLFGVALGISIIIGLIICHIKSSQRKYRPPPRIGGPIGSKKEEYDGYATSGVPWSGVPQNLVSPALNYVGPYYTGIYPYTWDGAYGSPASHYHPSHYPKYVPSTSHDGCY